MSALVVVDRFGKKVKDLELEASLWEGTIHESVVHQCVRSYRAAQRQGNASTKTRAEIKGSGAKPWKQKGTGRARSGTKKSPIWRGGGTVFGPKPRSYRFELPKKLKKLALTSVLRSRYQGQECTVIDDLSIALPKTKEMVQILNALKLGENVLVVTSGVQENVIKSSSNISKVKVCESSVVNAFDVLLHKHVLFTEEAVLDIQRRLLSEEVA